MRLSIKAVRCEYAGVQKRVLQETLSARDNEIVKVVVK